MKTLQHVTGDATFPIGNDNKLLIHVCNNVGKWGKGFVLAISKRWREPEFYFREYYNKKTFSSLGDNQPIRVEDNLHVVNMIAQNGIYSPDNQHPLNYIMLDHCLQGVAKLANHFDASIHCPKIGSGLANGDWEIIENLLIVNFSHKDIDVTVYHHSKV